MRDKYRSRLARALLRAREETLLLSFSLASCQMCAVQLTGNLTMIVLSSLFYVHLSALKLEEMRARCRYDEARDRTCVINTFLNVHVREEGTTSEAHVLSTETSPEGLVATTASSCIACSRDERVVVGGSRAICPTTAVATTRGAFI